MDEINITTENYSQVIKFTRCAFGEEEGRTAVTIYYGSVNNQASLWDRIKGAVAVLTGGRCILYNTFIGDEQLYELKHWLEDVC